MSEKYKIHPDGTFFVTLTVVGWIDIFTRREYADEVVANLNYCSKQKGLRIYSYCLMPSHLYIICSAERGNLSDILRDFKSYTAKRIINLIENNPMESRKEWLLHLFRFFKQSIRHNKEFQFWQQHNHPIDLTDTKIFQQKIDYIEQNPVVAGLVTDAAYYTFSSANPDSDLNLAEV
ncbi:transposase IS200 family protein [Pontibacter mucosus]|uniref:Transposase IS200 family protein n=1 Tax=Pontibacter mucosus TaxID=1649266 RepID=A0A2T5YJ28_9BACT|nr:transposase [Pontibacter mucosus]PTX19312.1 transposase IS200 family protein [Pontibacter mucosus]